MFIESLSVCLVAMFALVLWLHTDNDEKEMVAVFPFKMLRCLQTDGDDKVFSDAERETWWRHFGGSRLMRLMRRGGGRIWGRNSSRCLGWVQAQASFANFNAPPLSTPRAGKILLESNNSESCKIVKKWHLSYVAARVNELKCESKDRATVYIFLFLSFV